MATISKVNIVFYHFLWIVAINEAVAVLVDDYEIPTSVENIKESVSHFKNIFFTSVFQIAGTKLAMRNLKKLKNHFKNHKNFMRPSFLFKLFRGHLNNKITTNA